MKLTKGDKMKLTKGDKMKLTEAQRKTLMDLSDYHRKIEYIFNASGFAEGKIQRHKRFADVCYDVAIMEK